MAQNERDIETGQKQPFKKVKKEFFIDQKVSSSDGSYDMVVDLEPKELLAPSNNDKVSTNLVRNAS